MQNRVHLCSQNQNPACGQSVNSSGARALLFRLTLALLSGQNVLGSGFDTKSFPKEHMCLESEGISESMNNFISTMSMNQTIHLSLV